MSTKIIIGRNHLSTAFRSQTGDLLSAVLPFCHAKERNIFTGNEHYKTIGNYNLNISILSLGRTKFYNYE